MRNSRAPASRCWPARKSAAAICGTSSRAFAGSAPRWGISSIVAVPALSPPSRAGSPGARGSEVPPQVSADALEHRRFRLWDGELLAGYPLERVDIDPRRIGDDLARDGRDRVAVGVAARRHPAAQKILVEAVGRLARRATERLALGEPIAAAVRGMDLVGEDDVAGRVDAELVFGVDQDQPSLGGETPAADEQREPPLGHFLPLPLRQQAATEDVAR